MDKLTKYLVEGVLKNIPLTEDTKIKKIVGIYGGRFQPFGPHHLKTYKWLKSQFDDAYITTSDLKKPPRHPMNFKEKVRHMTKMGVSSDKIVFEKSPYVAKNLAKEFDVETTAFVYIFGAKDAGRLGGGGKYFQDFKKNKKNLKGHDEHGYYLVAPHQSVSVGGQEVSGTSMRQLLGSPKIDDSAREKLFKKMFGYFDKGIFQMMTNKFKKLFEVNEIEVPIKVGDTVLMGKFKNKKVVVKSIGFNDKGDMVINGKSASKFRLIPQSNIFDGKLKESSTNAGYGADAGEPDTGYTSPGKKRTIGKGAQPDLWYKKGGYEQLQFPVADDPYGDDTNRRVAKQRVTNPEIFVGATETDDFITTGVGEKGKNFVQALNPDIILDFLKVIDLRKIIKEASTTNVSVGGNSQGVDDGPRYHYGNKKTYKKQTKDFASKLGWEVLNYIVGDDTEIFDHKNEYPDGPVSDVSFAPSGVGPGGTRRERKHYTGKRAFHSYFKHINKVAEVLGYKVIDYLGADLISKHSLEDFIHYRMKKNQKKHLRIEKIFKKNYFQKNGGKKN